jgi:16S rRNA (adenine(1408)-N(1))-methyltransferase
MAEASRRAGRSATKGGLPNALFVAAAAERIPPELRGVADELTIAFPWGSLLRGALALDEEAARGITALMGPGATAVATLSIEDRDRLGLPSLVAAGERRALAQRWSRLGLDVCAIRPATVDELKDMPSTWARRLAAGRDRSAWRLEFEARRDGPPDRRTDEIRRPR